MSFTKRDLSVPPGFYQSEAAGLRWLGEAGDGVAVGEVLEATVWRAGDVLRVENVQCDELRADRDRIDVVRHPVEILVGGVSLSGTEARGLRGLVDDAIQNPQRPVPR
jgi:hypothetical protein